MILVNMISMEFTIISLLLELELLFAVIGIRIWSKCDWYGHGEQYANFFRNLEKNVISKIKFASLYLMKKK